MLDEMASSVKSLLPWKGTSTLQAGTYSDITILAQHREGEREIRCPVHMDILWARCYGLRAHIEHARELQVWPVPCAGNGRFETTMMMSDSRGRVLMGLCEQTLAPEEVYTVDVQQMARGALDDLDEEFGVSGEGEKFESLYETWEQLRARVSNAELADKNNKGATKTTEEKKDDRQHEWNPMTCISVPGTVPIPSSNLTIALRNESSRLKNSGHGASGLTQATQGRYRELCSDWGGGWAAGVWDTNAMLMRARIQVQQREGGDRQGQGHERFERRACNSSAGVPGNSCCKGKGLFYR